MTLQQLACRCLNITISSETTPDADRSAPVKYARVHVGDGGIKVSHSQLTLRRRAATADKIQWNTVSCLLCRTTVYRVANEVPPDFELRDGLVAPPGEEYAEGEILRGRDGFIEINLGSEGCMDAKAISAARDNAERYSDTFGLLLPSTPKPAALSNPSTPRPSSPQPSATPRSLLPTLPPLFHPPPYSPSHPVFVRLSKTALDTSAQYREEAERAIQAFVDAQVAEVLQKERHLRGQVELIWARWRDSWKQETDSGSPAESHPLAHAGVVVPVKEFSPTAVPGSSPATQGSTQRRPSVHSTGPSMLSQSLRQSHFIPPPQSATSTPSPQLPAPVNGVKNPLDDSFAVSASFQIRAGDALRARESAKEAEERRRKRLSLSGKSSAPPAVPEEQSAEEDHVTAPRNGVAEGKRKVTFQADVKEEDGGSQPVPRRTIDGADGDGEETGTPIMFDLDDDDGTDQVEAETDEQNPSEEPTPTTPRARLKAKSKKTAQDPPKIGHKAAVPALLTVNLGPSPGSVKPKPSPKSPAITAESPKARTVRPGEDKLLELVAANYPSHRTAWLPNGKAWEFFDARRKFADSPDSVSMTSSEDSNGGKWLNPSQFATSLPVTIAAGPLASSAEREPKTSLHNEPGALVPPLRLDQTTRQTRERTYAQRDLARSVDPGPVLELQAAEDAADETDEEEEDVVGEMSSAERVRRRTMRIVQRQSGVPDAGMWRSVAS